MSVTSTEEGKATASKMILDGARMNFSRGMASVQAINLHTYSMVKTAVENASSANHKFLSRDLPCSVVSTMRQMIEKMITIKIMKFVQRATVVSGRSKKSYIMRR